MLLLFLVILFSQVKGVTPSSSSAVQDSLNETYALVIGISDYQDEDIPDLNYANKDARWDALFEE